MAETLINIPIGVNTWVNLCTEAGINTGTPMEARNVGSSDIYITRSYTQPSVDLSTVGYTILRRDNGLSFKSQTGDPCIWAFSNSEGGAINVEVSGPVDYYPQTAYGENATADSTPVIQIKGISGISGKTRRTTVGSGTVSSNGEVLIASTGTDATGLAGISSEMVLPDRPGQGQKAILSVQFAPPAAGNIQFAGLNNPGNGYNFVYLGTAFGILRRSHGEQEIQELTITVAAAGAEVAVVTVDGAPYNVNLTAGTTATNAAQIATRLNAEPTLANWQFHQNGNVVVARYDLARPVAGVFAFTSATAQAAWVQIVAGAAAVNYFTPQALWNANTSPDIVPTNGNVYLIQAQPGYGVVVFSVLDWNLGQFVTVHRIKYPNTSQEPIVSNPSMLVGISTVNQGNTTDIRLQAADLAGFIEGKNVLTDPPRGADVTKTGVGGTEVPLITLRNRLATPTGRSNLAETKIIDVEVLTDSTKGMVFNIYVNGVLTGARFSYVDKDNSITSIDTSATAVTGTRRGQLISVAGVPARFTPEDLFIGSGDTITVTGRVTSGAASEATVLINYREDR